MLHIEAKIVSSVEHDIYSDIIRVLISHVRQQKRHICYVCRFINLHWSVTWYLPPYLVISPTLRVTASLNDRTQLTLLHVGSSSISKQTSSLQGIINSSAMARQLWQYTEPVLYKAFHAALKVVVVLHMSFCSTLNSKYFFGFLPSSLCPIFKRRLTLSVSLETTPFHCHAFQQNRTQCKNNLTTPDVPESKYPTRCSLHHCRIQEKSYLVTRFLTMLH